MSKKASPKPPPPTQAAKPGRQPQPLNSLNRIAWDGINSLDRYEFKRGKPSERRIYQMHVDIPISQASTVTAFHDSHSTNSATDFVTAILKVVEDANADLPGQQVIRLSEILDEMRKNMPDSLGPWSVALKYASRDLDGNDLDAPQAFIDFRATVNLKSVDPTDSKGLFKQMTGDIVTGGLTEPPAQGWQSVFTLVEIQQPNKFPGVGTAMRSL